MFKAIGKQKEIGLAVSLGMRLTTVLPVIIGGIIFLFDRRTKTAQQQSETA
jgi:glucose uptake protein GlcU